ncbi:tripartite tricarboxylate transporter TctB family protein [Phreatobacter stygius]|uniref:Tripartite tricarboxylate transporter TctB family protein n=1 Tax=Phreatobacter stygius TaxID=1940610 RepID=A0A4D7B768_9HYPH|nr:tripartite tricarboxylate transporter TctB family protein [Phreatobacter stygius]QCI66855.1 tripartite tricarboxylate transporter TctB family protein [Phreatobacter stygius]
MGRINVPDLAFGLFLVGVGALALVLISDLPMGTTARMGAGYVPRALAVIIILFGLGLGGRALLAGHVGLPEIAWRPLALIAGAVGLFALLLPRLGLALTSLAVVITAGFASHDVRFRENIVVALSLAAFAVGLFVYALGLPLAIWPVR